MAQTRDRVENTSRILLSSPYNTRNLDNTNTSSLSASGVVGLGIVGIMIVGDSATSVKDKRFVNCFPETITDKSTGVSRHYVTKRPGFAALNTPAAGQIGTAIKVWSVNSDKIITAFGGTNSTIYDGTTSLGAITGKAVAMEETLISGTPYMVIASDNNTAWYTTGGAPTQIVDGDFPGQAGRTITGGFVFIDGFAFIMDTSGRIYNSDLNSVTAWTAASYREANMYPDNGLGLARYKNLLVAFGKETVEFFYNSGQNPVGSPLERYEQGFVHFGCLNQYSFTQLEDTVAWVSASDRSGMAVYILDGLQPKRISNPYIDTQLSLVASNSVYVTSAKFVGKTFVIITTTGTTFVYIVEDDAWHEWTSDMPLWHHISGTTSGTRELYSVCHIDTMGKVFVVSPSSLAYNDDGFVFTYLIQTTKFDADNSKYKFGNRLTVIGDTTPTANALSISWSDDDYQTFSTPVVVDLSDNEPYIKNIGRFKRRAFNLSNTVDAPVRLEALEIDYKQGGH